MNTTIIETTPNVNHIGKRFLLIKKIVSDK